MRSPVGASRKRPQPARRIRGSLLERELHRLRINPLKADSLRWEPDRLNRGFWSPGGTRRFRPNFDW